MTQTMRLLASAASYKLRFVLVPIVFVEQYCLRNYNSHRFVRKLRRLAAGYAEGRLPWEDINPSVQSWIGHAKQAQTLGLRKRLFSEIVFQRGRT